MVYINSYYYYFYKYIYLLDLSNVKINTIKIHIDDSTATKAHIRTYIHIDIENGIVSTNKLILTKEWGIKTVAKRYR